MQIAHEATCMVLNDVILITFQTVRRHLIKII